VEIFRVLKPGARFVANEAVWRAGVSAERVAAVNAACLADFGVRQASAEPWALPDYRRLSQKHRLDGLLIEPRLFVLEKPPASYEL